MQEHDPRGMGGITDSLKREQGKTGKTRKTKVKVEVEMSQRAKGTSGVKDKRVGRDGGGDGGPGISRSADSEILGKRGGDNGPMDAQMDPEVGPCMTMYGRIHKIPPGEA